MDITKICLQDQYGGMCAHQCHFLDTCHLSVILLTITSYWMEDMSTTFQVNQSQALIPLFIYYYFLIVSHNYSLNIISLKQYVGIITVLINIHLFFCFLNFQVVSINFLKLPFLSLFEIDRSSFQIVVFLNSFFILFNFFNNFIF